MKKIVILSGAAYLFDDVFAAQHFIDYWFAETGVKGQMFNVFDDLHQQL